MTHYLHVRSVLNERGSLPAYVPKGLAFNASFDDSCTVLWNSEDNSDVMAQLEEALRKADVKFQGHDQPEELMTGLAPLLRTFTNEPCPFCTLEDASMPSV